MRYNADRLKEKTDTIGIPGVKALADINSDVLFNYNIFPANIMSYLTQWQAEHRAMLVGDTILQQVFVPPIKSFSQKIIFGVRISEIINDRNKKGFSYETLEGHVEKGISTFTLESATDGVVFKIHTLSSPGNLLTKLIGPVFSLPYQKYCTQKALQHVKKNILSRSRGK
ncbi:MAG: DUF1990 family protein [Sphingobacteriales bacterium]|nr:MAG: DUF1990 family protein [Sphingobacteriales bacterium]